MNLSKTLILSLTVLCPVVTRADDWPTWGGSADRNMVGKASGIPTEIVSGDYLPKSENIDMSTTKGVKWVAKLGSQTYGTPVVAGGKVFVGTNNESPRIPEIVGDRGVLMCLDEKTGEFLWQIPIPKLGAGKVSDWEFVGLCSSPAIDGNRGYAVTNRGEVMCFDVEGMANGNDGDFQDEASFFSEAPGGKVEINDHFGDIIWVVDAREELGVFPHNVSSCSPLVYGDRVYAATSNGVDWSHKNIPAPFAPALAVYDKNTGELLGEEALGVSERVLHASWSTPAIGSVNGKTTIVWGAGDGFCYGFEVDPVMHPDGFPVFKELFRYDANLPEFRMKDGEPIKYATYEGPSEIIATTVIYNNKAYMVIGQDPEHGDGVGMISCIDPSMRGDISGKPIWTYKDIGRSISTASIVDGLMYQAEYDGDIHCLDAETGKQYWVHETNSRIWSSTLVADGKVIIGNEDGELVMLKAGREKELLSLSDFYTPIYCSPVVANNTLFVTTQTHLYAIGK
ncbi:MAG: PQQ-binding-like beta-propeller repeat protein [Verrucomicrobiae bacterium]|nr:PQQ-binding-like beta-propeller repeat protein [Verrucomicrobiae bacterium]